MHLAGCLASRDNEAAATLVLLPAAVLPTAQRHMDLSLRGPHSGGKRRGEDRGEGVGADEAAGDQIAWGMVPGSRRGEAAQVLGKKAEAEFMEEYEGPSRPPRKMLRIDGSPHEERAGSMKELAWGSRPQAAKLSSRSLPDRARSTEPERGEAEQRGLYPLPRDKKTAPRPRVNERKEESERELKKSPKKADRVSQAPGSSAGTAAECIRGSSSTLDKETCARLSWMEALASAAAAAAVQPVYGASPVVPGIAVATNGLPGAAAAVPLNPLGLTSAEPLAGVEGVQALSRGARVQSAKGWGKGNWSPGQDPGAGGEAGAAHRSSDAAPRTGDRTLTASTRGDGAVLRRKVALHARMLPDDGHQWHKYGHKTLMDSSFSRAYYRCARRALGCNAKKTVDFPLKDGTELRITYDGTHNHEASDVFPKAVVVSHKGEGSGSRATPQPREPSTSPDSQHKPTEAQGPPSTGAFFIAGASLEPYGQSPTRPVGPTGPPTGWHPLPGGTRSILSAGMQPAPPSQAANVAAGLSPGFTADVAVQQLSRAAHWDSMSPSAVDPRSTLPHEGSTALGTSVQGVSALAGLAELHKNSTLPALHASQGLTTSSAAPLSGYSTAAPSSPWVTLSSPVAPASMQELALQQAHQHNENSMAFPILNMPGGHSSSPASGTSVADFRVPAGQLGIPWALQAERAAQLAGTSESESAMPGEHGPPASAELWRPVARVATGRGEGENFGALSMRLATHDLEAGVDKHPSGSVESSKDPEKLDLDLHL